MGLFDMFKNKATELLQGAKDQISELTGIELSPEGLTDQIGQAAGNLTDTAEGAINNAKDHVSELAGIELPTEGLTDQIGQAAGNLTDASQRITDTAEGAINSAKDKLTGN